MIVFVSTAEHAYTHKALLGTEIPIRVGLMTYGELLRAKAVPRATYVFTDMDRLSLWDLRLAALAFRRLRDQSVAVLNDPARTATRYGLLRRLYLAGINGFNAYRIEEGVKPQRWPVFLRAEGAHLGPMTDLIQDWEQLLSFIDQFVAKGIPLVSLLIVEFSAQPMRPVFYRKFSSFRMGRAEFAHMCVDDDHWIAKIGKRGVTPPGFYEDEFRIVRDNPYGPNVAVAFDIAGIDYGRVDFGLVDGKVQIYEINSNPDVTFGDDHPSAVRQQSYRIFRERYLSALSAIDAATTSGTVTIG